MFIFIKGSVICFALGNQTKMLLLVNIAFNSFATFAIFITQPLWLSSMIGGKVKISHYIQLSNLSCVRYNIETPEISRNYVKIYAKCKVNIKYDIPFLNPKSAIK